MGEVLTGIVTILYSHFPHSSPPKPLNSGAYTSVYCAYIALYQPLYITIAKCLDYSFRSRYNRYCVVSLVAIMDINSSYTHANSGAYSSVYYE